MPRLKMDHVKASELITEIETSLNLIAKASRRGLFSHTAGSKAKSVKIILGIRDWHLSTKITLDAIFDGFNDFNNIIDISRENIFNEEKLNNYLMATTLVVRDAKTLITTLENIKKKTSGL